MAPNASEFLVNVARVKQSHEFFSKLENELELLVNTQLGQADDGTAIDESAYVVVDLKMQDKWLPSWLNEQVRSMRKLRKQRLLRNLQKA